MCADEAPSRTYPPLRSSPRRYGRHVPSVRKGPRCRGRFRLHCDKSAAVRQKERPPHEKHRRRCRTDSAHRISAIAPGPHPSGSTAHRSPANPMWRSHRIPGNAHQGFSGILRGRWHGILQAAGRRIPNAAWDLRAISTRRRRTRGAGATAGTRGAGSVPALPFRRAGVPCPVGRVIPNARTPSGTGRVPFGCRPRRSISTPCLRRRLRTRGRGRCRGCGFSGFRFPAAVSCGRR